MKSDFKKILECLYDEGRICEFLEWIDGKCIGFGIRVYKGRPVKTKEFFELKNRDREEAEYWNNVSVKKRNRGIERQVGRKQKTIGEIKGTERKLKVVETVNDRR